VFLHNWMKAVLKVTVALVLAAIYLPLFLVALNSFSSSETLAWPPPGFTTRWWRLALQSEGALAALATSVQVALAATAISLVLGTFAAFALTRHRFFGQRPISLLIILPIALPGIVTGVALNNAFRTMMGVKLGVGTLIVAHATFCIVTVFNNVSARLRTTGDTLEQAARDLGAGPWRTFWLVTLPQLRSALLAGGLLAFALSFDEIIVTTFTAGSGTTTLPIWIMQNMFRPGQAPIVAVVAVVLIVISVAPLMVAQRLTGAEKLAR